MAYSEALADRIRRRLAEVHGVVEKPMMGGLTFMVDGKMCVGIIKDELMCRIDPDDHEAAIARPGCRTMDFTHRPMIGYVLVDESGMEKTRDFNAWIAQSLRFNPKAKASRKKS